MTPWREEVVTGADVWLGIVDEMMVEEDQNNSRPLPPQWKWNGENFVARTISSSSWEVIYSKISL